MKFGQLIEYNIKNIFLEKSYTKCGRETIPRPFSKKSKLSLTLDQHFKVYIFGLIVCQVKDYWKRLKLSCRPFTFTSYKAVLKNKGSGTSLPDSLSAWYLKKNVAVVTFYYLTKFQCLVAFTSWGIGQYVYCNCLLTRLWLNNFEINLIFLIKEFLLHNQNVKIKI